MKRVTQANVEANIEIEMYQSKMEKHFQEFENKFKESFEGIAAKIVADTDAFIIKMLEGAQKNKELVSKNIFKDVDDEYFLLQVIQELLNIIFEVKPEIHRNYYFLSTYE